MQNSYNFWLVAFSLVGATLASHTALDLTGRRSAAGVRAALLSLSNAHGCIAATLALQSRILIWAGTRELFGATAPWRAGFAVTAVFCVLYGSALMFKGADGAARRAACAVFPAVPRGDAL
ncbi:MAG TPA: hypothetical protein VEN30_09300 [Paraburkholderia sp.]|nr:hypothetical protein [Paraburkholderia sp.]